MAQSPSDAERIRVHPPGPFPPSGDELPGEVDLGIRLRDTLFRRAVVLDARKALQGNIKAASRSSHQVLMALPAIDAYLDTYPLASMIEDAVAQWRVSPTPEALTILARAAEVIGSVLGWPRSVDRRWPLPDESWMRRQVEGPAVVIPRGPRDGSAAAAVALNAVLGFSEGINFPEMVTVHGDQLTDKVGDLTAAIRLDVVKAVDVAGWIPWDEASQQAHHELSTASELQASYGRCGLAALVAGGGGIFDELLGAAPPGEMGERLRATCEVVVVPHLVDGGVEPHGVLVWDDRYAPVRVNPIVGTVVDLVHDQPTLDELATRLNSERDVVDDVVRQLVEVGAVTAC